jgi:rubrerythrin
MTEKNIIEEMDGVIKDVVSPRTNVEGDKIALEILELGMKLETLIGEHYSHLARNVKNESGKSVFEYLAKEADEELRVLKAQHSALKEDRTWLATEEVKPAANVCPVVAPEKDVEKSGDVLPTDSDIEKGESDLEALGLAIEVKKRAIKFYCEASSRLNNDYGKKMFAHLIELEEKHLKELEVQYQWLQSTGFWYNPDMMTD